MVGNLAKQLKPIKMPQVEVKDSPVEWSSVSLSKMIERGKRLEASVFNVQSKAALKAIDACPFEKIPLIGNDGFVEKAHYGGRLKRNYVSQTKKGAVGFIGSSEMLDIMPRPVKFMINDLTVDALRVKLGTVLISRSGTIGNLSFVNRTLEKLLVSEHAIRLECSEFPGYVYAFLKSKTGQSIIQSQIYGAVIQQIEPQHLATIPVPNPSKAIKSKIHNLIEKSYELRDESNDLLQQAYILLTKELELPPIRELHVDLIQPEASVQAFSVKLSNLVGRVDGSYHAPISDAIVKHLQEYAAEVTTVGDQRISENIILPDRFKRVYVDKAYGRVFIGGKQLRELDPSNKKYLSLKRHACRIKEQLELHENMTLITRSGTIGKVALVPKHWKHWVASEHIIRVVPANCDISGYIYVFLSSEYGHSLITRYTYGSVVDEIDDNNVASIPIPLLKNKDIQNQINNLALQANEKRYQAYKLEQKALKTMDDEVIFAK